MSNFKGTPGPWVASNYYSDATTILDSKGFSVADAPRCLILEGYSDKGFQHWADSEKAHRWIPEDEQRANAQLIAAAPELLEGLQEMVAIVKKNTYPQPDKPNSTWGRMEAAEAVIKKALGQ